MTTKDRPPNEDELLAMAYVDGELDPAGLESFERRLAQSRDLRLEVAQLQKLALLARQVAPPEPKDCEWRKLEAEPLHRAGLGTGFCLALMGALGAASIALYAILTAAALALEARLCIGALALGILILFLTVLRARLRTLPFDPYTEIER